MNNLQNLKEKVEKLCQLYNVKSLYAFGSVLNEKYNDKSDIDLIVDFNLLEIKDYFNNYYDFKFSLENELNRPIDLLEEQSIKNPYFRQSINQNRELIYGK